MRICMLQSSFEGSKSVFKAEDSMPDPGYYADPEHHVFEHRYIRKFAEKDDIDKIVAEGFDMYWNFMWGQHYDDVSGIEATRYLESKGVPLIGSPADYMAYTKEDLVLAAKKTGQFLVPGNTPNRFPKIVKFVDGMASLGMDADSICYDQAAVDAKVQSLRVLEPEREILVQDFIRGIETTAIVMEMGDAVVALPPVDWVFQNDVPVDKAWLSYTSKFEDLEAGRIHFEFVADEERRLKICDAAVAAFKALGLQGRGTWGRLDARVDHETGDVYCLEMNHLPAVFFPNNEAFSDDIIIRQAYPGGHEAFIDTLIYTKQYQVAHPNKSYDTVHRVTNSVNGNHSAKPVNGDVEHKVLSDTETNGATVPVTMAATNGIAKSNGVHLNGSVQNGVSSKASTTTATSENKSKPIGDLRAHGKTIAEVYDSAAPAYDAVQAKMAIRQWQIEYFDRYDYSGTVLDLACGTGGIGMLIQEAGHNASIHGVDVSPVSLQTEQVKKYYASSSVGWIQEAIMTAAPVDHIVCFGALHFISRIEFNATLSRMFMLARKSIAFDVDDMTQEYMDKILEAFGEGLRQHNLIKPYKRFGTPNGWKKVVEEERSLFYSPSVQIDVRGIVVRFEKL